MEENGAEIRKLKEVTGWETDLEEKDKEERAKNKEPLRKRGKIKNKYEGNYESNGAEKRIWLRRRFWRSRRRQRKGSNLSQERDDISTLFKKENFQYYYMQSNSRLFLLIGN